jgi:hypothetical protein
MVPPEILMGEAGLCGFWAMVAVAYVYSRNDQMNGWQDRPSVQANLAAMFWRYLPDVSRKAHYVFSAEDVAGGAVQGLVGRGPPKIVWPCEVGSLMFY